MKIILTLEQFPVFLPGAYGNKTQKTPGLDAFTLKSTVFDRAYSTRADGLETLFQLWEACDFSSPEFAGRKLFISDLPVEAPAFFDAGRTVSSDEFFASPEMIFSLVSSENVAGKTSEEYSFIWIHFQMWDWNALDAWISEERIQNQLLALLGTSGEIPEGDVRMYSAEVQLPWWVRFSDSKFAGTRSHALVTPDDFQKILKTGNPDAVYRDFIRIHAENERWALVTEEWFLTGFDAPPPGASDSFSPENSQKTESGKNMEQNSYAESEADFEEDSRADADFSDTYETSSDEEEEPPELYFKPADWWDQNDVAVRCFDEIQRLKRYLNDSENPIRP